MSDPNLCNQEDRAGRVCRLGLGHQARCRFGSRRLTGLVRRTFIGMRWQRFELTQAGRIAVLEELER